MSIRNSVLIGSGIIGLLATSSLALYYWNQAAYYERAWKDAVAQIGTGSISSPAVVEPILANRKTRTAAQTQNVKSNSDADTGSDVRLQPVPQGPATEKPAPVVSTVRAPGATDQGRQSRRGTEWLENMRTNNPQLYEEIQQRRKDMQQHAETAWDQATDYFVNRDTSRMTDPEIEGYNRMMTLLEETRALTRQLQVQVDLPRDDRRQLMSNVRSNIVELTPLLENERNKEYYDLAIAKGYSEADANALVTYINQITSNTSIRTIFPDMRGGGPGGPGFRPPDGMRSQTQR
jgi:hypothetical protein